MPARAQLILIAVLLCVFLVAWVIAVMRSRRRRRLQKKTEAASAATEKHTQLGARLRDWQGRRPHTPIEDPAFQSFVMQQAWVWLNFLNTHESVKDEGYLDELLEMLTPENRANFRRQAEEYLAGRSKLRPL